MEVTYNTCKEMYSMLNRLITPPKIGGAWFSKIKKNWALFLYLMGYRHSTLCFFYLAFATSSAGVDGISGTAGVDGISGTPGVDGIFGTAGRTCIVTFSAFCFFRF